MKRVYDARTVRYMFIFTWFFPTGGNNCHNHHVHEVRILVCHVLMKVFHLLKVVPVLIQAAHEQLLLLCYRSVWKKTSNSCSGVMVGSSSLRSLNYAGNSSNCRPGQLTWILFPLTSMISVDLFKLKALASSLALYIRASRNLSARSRCFFCKSSWNVKSEL